jgi:hypothetical protein
MFNKLRLKIAYFIMPYPCIVFKSEPTTGDTITVGNKIATFKEIRRKKEKLL